MLISKNMFYGGPLLMTVIKKKCKNLLFQVDMIKLSSFPVLKRFLGTDEGLELKVH